nr:MAG TPA: hypothetical protein [Caudoviricetes sp.]
MSGKRFSTKLWKSPNFSRKKPKKVQKNPCFRPWNLL